VIEMSELPNKILDISKVYSGPAANVFLQRQTKNHMGGLNFDDIDSSKLQELSKWINTSAALLIEKSKAEEFSKKVAILT